MRKRKQNAAILGVGLDHTDEDVRYTKGENFHLVGGSEQTHEVMQEQCIKFNEKLSERGKELGELERDEFMDMAAECDMNVLAPRPVDPNHKKP